MKAVFTQAFGTYVPGDEIELPDGCVYDGSYLSPVEAAQPNTKTDDGGDK